MKRFLTAAVTGALAVLLTACPEPGPPGPPGPPGTDEPVTSVEACTGCHGPAGAVPVADIETPGDAHFIDTDEDGPLTPSGYRALDVELTGVDVRGSNVVIDFDASAIDENGNTVDVMDLFAGDGRFTIARLDAGSNGDADDWVSLITRLDAGTVQGTAERFSSGTFMFMGGGSYRYTSSFDPSSVPVVSGNTLRVAIQISEDDLPAGNGWCDFTFLGAANDCTSPVAITRDIVRTDVCNECHGVTSDTKLALHGGGRTEVEYCVTCHDPASADGQSGNTIDFKVMIHKIHRGANLSNLPYVIFGFGGTPHDYSNVQFTKDIDNCWNCHGGGGADLANWFRRPTIETCGSCHDDVNFETGANHLGGRFTDNRACAGCHPPAGAWVPGGAPAPVQTVHRGAARTVEGLLYAGTSGFSIEDVSFDPATRVLTIDYLVRKNGTVMNLQTAPEWTAIDGASRLALTIGWDTWEYTNLGSGSPPASPISLDGLTGTPIGMGVYRLTQVLPDDAEGTVTVSMEGHPAADLIGNGSNCTGAGNSDFCDRIAVKNVFFDLDIDGGRAVTEPRRVVVDTGKCNQCHDSAAAGISLHGNNRTGEVQVCVVCHNPNNTDINRRPADPSLTADGKKEESIDMKRLIHQIHSGAELQDGIVVWGFGFPPVEHDFSNVGFIGNRQNCETCHNQGTYGSDDAWATLPSTIDTGADVADPDDDLNISPTAAVCSSCHDSTTAKDHMKLHGASFIALDEDIH